MGISFSSFGKFTVIISQPLTYRITRVKLIVKDWPSFSFLVTLFMHQVIN
jgi:hypothetical protein